MLVAVTVATGIVIRESVSGAGLTAVMWATLVTWAVASRAARRSRVARSAAVLAQATVAVVAVVTPEHPAEAIAFAISVACVAVFLPLRLSGPIAALQLTAVLVLLSVLSVQRMQPHIAAGWLSVPWAAAFATGVGIRAVTLARDRAQALAARLQAVHTVLERSNRAGVQLAAGRERARIARDIHDSIGHSLTSSHMQLELARRHLDRGDTPGAEVAMDKGRAAADRGLEELRSCLAVLREDDTPRSERAFPEVLRTLATGFRPPSTSAHFDTIGEAFPISSARQTALARVLQESMTNAAKHAHASRIDVRLRYDADAAVLEVEDDGDGCAEVIAGNGLMGLAERVEDCGGTLTYEAVAGGGFAVRATLPRTSLVTPAIA
ncbi:MAG: sensor histidine kinase [Myxococcota bacterium]